METPNLTLENVEKIEKLFPNCVKETEDEEGNKVKKIDFDLLRAELWDKASVEWLDERYRLDWPWKKRSILKANTPITKTLRPVKEDSVDWDNTQNIYIEGDNFEVLKILQESYLWKIKMIYIDPPYNTGNDFVYNDDFSEDSEEYKERTEQDVEWYKMVKNTESNGRFHSDWLSMMYERLKVARDLLSNEWCIFISIDDNELDNLRKICDEIFWENNFVGNFTVENNPKWRKNSHFLSVSSEYCVCFAKDKNQGGFIENIAKDVSSLKIDSNGNYYSPGKRVIVWESSNDVVSYESEKHFSVYYNSDNNDIKIIKEKEINECNKSLLDSWYKRYISSDWENFLENSYTQTEFINIYNNDWLLFKENSIYEKDFNLNTRIKSIITDMEYQAIRDGKEVTFKIDVKTETAWKELKKLGIPFDMSKNHLFIKLLISLFEKDWIVLDFFSGSATTAHSLLQYNAEYNKNSQFILVQLPENLDDNLKTVQGKAKTTVKNWIKLCDSLGKPHLLTEIWKERIRRAAKKIKEETNADIDYWFRVYRVDESCMKDVYYHPSEAKQENLALFTSNIKEDRTPEDLLTQVILNFWLTLDLPIEEKKIWNNKVFYVAWNSLIACFDENIDDNVIDEIAKDEPIKLVFRDACFKNDAQRINVENKVKRVSPETIIKVI